MVEVLGFENALFAYAYPTVVAMPFTFAALIILSRLDKSARGERERSNYDEQALRSELGTHVEEAKGH